MNQTYVPEIHICNRTLGFGRCLDGSCFELYRTCDGFLDCSDGYDEAGCEFLSGLGFFSCCLSKFDIKCNFSKQMACQGAFKFHQILECFCRWTCFAVAPSCSTLCRSVPRRACAEAGRAADSVAHVALLLRRRLALALHLHQVGTSARSQFIYSCTCGVWSKF